MMFHITIICEDPRFPLVIIFNSRSACTNCSKSFPANTVLVSVWSCSRMCGTNFDAHNPLDQSIFRCHFHLVSIHSPHANLIRMCKLVTFSSFLHFAGLQSCSASCSNSLTIFKWTAPVIHNGCFEHQQHFYFRADCSPQTCPSPIQLAS